MSSSSLVVGFAASSSLDSSEGESYKKKEKKAIQTGTNVNLFSKVIKKEEIVSYLCYFHLAPCPQAPPPSLIMYQ